MNKHDHRTGSLCNPCADELDNIAEDLYEEFFDFAQRWANTMPAGESLEHLVKVTQKRVLYAG